MKILFMTTHLNMGGITRYLLILTKGLIGRGHEVHIASGGGAMQSGFEELGAKTITLRIRTKSELNPNIYFALRPLGNYIRTNKIDVIHAQTRITQVMGTLLNRRHKKPYVSTCHGYFRVRWSRVFWPCWGNVIAISPAVFEHLRHDFKVASAKIFLVPHGIDLTDFPDCSLEEKHKNRKKFNLTDEITIGMIARLSDVKGQDILIEAMPEILKEVPHAKLLLFGEGKMKEYLLKQVKKLGLQDRVLFFPIVNKTRESLSVIDCVVVPSRQEGLGLSIMEAQACGIPVVATNVGGIPSLIQDNVTGLLVEPNNVKELSNAVVRLLKDEQLRHSIGVAARQHALSHYSSDLMVDKTLNVYQRVLGIV